MRPVEFGTNKKKIKILGSLLSVEKSYIIVKLLLKKPLMLKTISKKLGFKKSLISYYIKKLEKAGILIREIKKDTDRNKLTPYYSVKPFILSMPKGKNHD